VVGSKAEDFWDRFRAGRDAVAHVRGITFALSGEDAGGELVAGQVAFETPCGRIGRTKREPGTADAGA
jgi:hypothetical protein